MNFIIFALVITSAASWGTLSRVRFHEGHSGSPKQPTSFAGAESWRRKYKQPLSPAKPNLYNKLFKLKYQERFPLSATLLVWTTDLYHLCQFVTINSLLLALALLASNTLIAFALLWLAYHIGFYITYYTGRK